MAHDQYHRTYRVKAPLATHFRAFTEAEQAAGTACQESGCVPYRTGWKLRWEGLSQQDQYDATHCGRRYRVVHIAEGETWLEYEPGQPCFAASKHRVRIDKPELFVVRDGMSAPRIHTRPDDWVDDLHNHTDRVNAIRERG